MPRSSLFGRANPRGATNIWVTPHDVARLMSTVALEKVASDVAEGVTPHRVARLVPESRHAGSVPCLDQEFSVSFSRVYLVLLIRKWAPKFVKLELYDL
jgi:hypothetical protein